MTKILAALLALVGPHAEAAESRVLQKGETIGSICERLYGSEHYADLLAIHNGADSPSKLRAGQRVVFPSMVDLIREARLTAQAQRAGEEAALAQQALQSVSTDLIRHRQQRVADGGTLPLPRHIQVGLESARQHLRAALTQLEPLFADGGANPSSTRGQWLSAASLLTAMAEGTYDGYSYDLADSHRRIGYGMLYLLRSR